MRAAVPTLALCLSFASGGALACPLNDLHSPVTELAAPNLTLGYSLQPEGVRIGQVFSLEVVVCRGDGAKVAGPLQVDAVMPDHGHGMNTRPKVTDLDDGWFRADGFLFHMPGRWQFRFVLPTGDTPLRLSSDLLVE